MKKKLLALLLSGAMILSLTTPVALAEEPEGECCGTCGQVECVCPPEEAPCEVCGEIECVCPPEEAPCEVCGEIECECEKIEEPEVPEAPEIPEEPTVCEICGEIECICEGVNDYAELYEALMDCESVEEMDALLEELSEEEIPEFFESLTEEEFVALNDLMIELETVEEAGEIIYGDIVYADNGIVDVTDAAPFLDPVVGAAPRMRMMMAAAGSRAAAADPLKLSKRVSGPDQEGKYTLTLEAYATGSVTVNTETETVPTDIILVLDQSGSMEESMGNYQAYRGASGSASTIYSQHRNDLYAKVGNDYKKVTITTVESETPIAVSTLGWKYNTNMKEYADADNLFYLHTDGKYYPVTVTKNRQSRYTYTCDVWTDTSDKDYGTPPSINKLYYTDTSVTGYTFTYEGADGTTVTETYNASGANSTVAADKYYYQYTDSQSRLDALTAAVTNFADAVAEKAAGPDKDITTKEDNVNHRIAMVGFASDYRNDSYDKQYTRYCNTEVFVGSNQYLYNDGATDNASDADSAQSHYDEAFQSMDTPDGIDNIEDSIGVLAAKGGTFINLGLEMANGIFSENPIPTGTKRNRVVVVFTDGEPGWSGFNTTPANNAIAQANIAKNTYGATVYTVGVFTDANASIPVLNTASDANKFMHYVSSNFKNATSMSNTGDPTYPTTGSYYLSASNSDALNDIFETISNNIVSGKTDVTLDAKAVVQDVISPYFKLPNGTDEDDIKVYTADYAGNGTFKDRDPYAAAEVKVDEEAKTVQVSNFSFKDNFVGNVETDGVVTGCVGKKLIIEIPIIVEPEFLGDSHIPTNAEESAIYDANETKVEAFPVPYVDIPTTVTVKKLVDGGSTEDFGFTASYDMWAGTYTNIEENGSNYLKANGTTNSESFELGDGKSHAIVDVLVGSEITISEAANSRYHVAKVEVNGEEVEAVDGVYKITVTPGMTITFTNARSVADLKITKTGWQAIDPNQSFIFDVKNREGKVVNRVTICENGSVVLKDLPVDTYTVEEVENWSWRYSATRYIPGGFDETVDALKAKTNNSQKVNLANGDQQILVVNERDQIYWLDGNDWCQNIFGENAAIVTPAGKTAVGTAATTEEDEDE